MPTLAGWITGEQVPQEVIEQTLATMSTVLAQHGGIPARTTQPGAGLVAFSDQAFAMRQNDEAAVLDWVPDRRTLVYRRPLSGQHALYYLENWPAEGNLLFASEIKALFAVGAPRHLNLAALDALLRYGFIPAPWTAFKDIKVVPAGSILRWQRAKIVMNQSTDYHLEEPDQSSDIVEQLYTLLDDASKAQLPPHEQVVALTSGGPASALATLLAAHHTTTPFTITTFSNVKSVNAKTWQPAEQVANACQYPFLAITGVDQADFWASTLAGTETPSRDTRPLALHQLLHTVTTEMAARVAITGLGALPLLDNNLVSQKVRERKQLDILTQYSTLLTTRHSEQDTAKIWTPEAQEILRTEERWEQTMHARKLARKAEQFSDKQLAHYYLDLHLRLPDQIVGPAQQLAIQEQLALRSPYLNTRVMDLLAHIPHQLRDNTSQRELVMELLARHQVNISKMHSPTLTVPTASLLHPASSEILQQTLSREALKETGIFNVEMVEDLLKPGKKISEKELLFVFTTQLLSRLFGATVQ